MKDNYFFSLRNLLVWVDDWIGRLLEILQVVNNIKHESKVQENSNYRHNFLQKYYEMHGAGEMLLFWPSLYEFQGHLVDGWEGSTGQMECI